MLTRIASRISGVVLSFGRKDLQSLLNRPEATFGVMSAYDGTRSKSSNKTRHGELVQDLQKAGLRFHDLKGSWGGKTEKSVLVPGASFEQMLALSGKYGQDAFVYKDESGTVGVYWLDGRVEIAVDPSYVNVSNDEALYSKGRGMSFSIDGFIEMSWDGEPITMSDLEAA